MNDHYNAVSTAARYEQLAEECVELAHAALKTARILRGENPTPRSLPETQAKVKEEYSDVVQTAVSLDIFVDEDQMKSKDERWRARILGLVDSEKADDIFFEGRMR
jgi:NTP pyrophosphatase (non-canonical NTP hydrolase)